MLLSEEAEDVETPGVVLSIHLQPRRGQPPISAAEARALVDQGLEGDCHGKQRSEPSRQVLLADRRTLETLGFAHGALREQLTVDFPGLDSLPRGTRLQVGEAVLEVTETCEPCEVIGALNGVADPIALRESLRGCRGIMANVVATSGDGRIRPGDAVVAVPSSDTPAAET